MTTPTPGRPVRGSQTGRPIMAALDLLGRRWALRVLWELREAGLLESGAGGYRLTRAGMQLKDALAPLDGWAKRWAAGRSAT